MTVSIRPATREDAGKLYQMIYELACYERAEHSVKVTIDDLSLQLSQSEPPFECIIAEIDRKPSGFALYFYAYSTWEGARTLYLEDLYVKQEFRGAGVGIALMRYLARVAHEKGCKRLEWSVLDWNEVAIDFYQKIGAKPVNGWERYRLDADTIGTLLSSQERAQSLV